MAKLVAGDFHSMNQISGQAACVLHQILLILPKTLAKALPGLLEMSYGRVQFLTHALPGLLILSTHR
jgi:hypothetical protein